MCKFGSLLIYIFFYVKNYFPTCGDVIWDKKKPVTVQINDFIKEIGDDFEGIMDNYFIEFKKKMRNRT